MALKKDLEEFDFVDDPRDSFHNTRLNDSFKSESEKLAQIQEAHEPESGDNSDEEEAFLKELGF